MKKFVPILLVLLILLGTANADGIRMYVLCKPGDYVNVRENPSTKSAVAGYLECGYEVETDGKTKKDNQGREWTHLTEPMLECSDVWVCSMYLQDTKVTIQELTGKIHSKGRTAVRRSPGGKIIKWLRNGDDVSILAMSGEWALTTRGYVRSEYIEVSE